MYPVAYISNELKKTVHPIIFTYYPYRWLGEQCTVRRYKSINHHIEGFSSLEEAINWVEEQKELYSFINTRLYIGEWDGESSPATVYWFEDSILLACESA